MSKFLLLAAYIASRNKETLDKRVFVPGAAAKRRRGALSSDRHVGTRCALCPPYHVCSWLAQPRHTMLQLACRDHGTSRAQNELLKALCILHTLRR